MNHLKMSARIDRFPEYIFSSLAKAVVEVEKETNRKVLNLGPGSPDVRPSEIYLEKFVEYIKEPGSHLYPGYQAVPEFADALIKWYKKRFGVVLAADEILPLLGAKDGVSHLPLALADEGDEVLVPNPGYPAYTGPILMLGAKPIPYDLRAEDNFKMSVKNLTKLVNQKTKYIWVNFPANPTGQVATLAELEEIVAFSKKHGLILVYDNAYSEITFAGFTAPSILQVQGAKDIAVEIGSFSKAFSFAGFRMGWIVGNKNIITALAKLKSQLDSGLSLPLQKLGAFALSNPDNKWTEQMISSYQKRRDIIAAKLVKLGLSFSLPQGALYIWAKIPDSALNSEDFCRRLLKEKQILLTPGSAFGTNGDRFVRVSICSNIELIDEYV
jgi:aspartate/methionine/tyrosine aminotransferase